MARTRYPSGRYGAATRPGIKGAGTGGGTFEASQGKKAPRGRTKSGAPRAMNRPPK